MNRSRTLRASVLVAAAFAMSACSTHPGSAAVVGSDSISDGHLDDVATALCAAQSGSGQAPQQALASRAARQGALDVLISGSLSEQFGASQGAQASQGQLSAALAANKKSIDALPSSSRSVFRQTLSDYAKGQLMVVDVGRKALTTSGTANPTPQQALAAGTKLRDAWTKKHLQVSVDPRYGTFSGGALVAGSGSLSAPVSASAVAGAAKTPSATWTAALPANQKCS